MNQVEVTRIALEVTVEIVAILANIICLYLVKKQNFATIDLWLAGFMSIADIILLLYRLCLLIIVNIIGHSYVFANTVFGQFDGVFELFMITSSVNCVGMLALIRFWCLYLKKNIQNHYLIIIYGCLQGIIFALLLTAGVRSDLILMPANGNYYPNPETILASTRAATSVLIFSNLLNILIVNLCYPFLAHKYIHEVQSVRLVGDHPMYPIKQVSKFDKLKVIFKTITMLIIYNICMIPNLIVNIMEQVTQSKRSLEQDNLVVITVLLLYAVNPLMFLILNDSIYVRLKSTIRSFFCPLGRTRSYKTNS